MQTRNCTSIIVVLATSVFLAVAAWAADADPTGLWTWTNMVDGQTRTTTLRLERKDGKLVGAFVADGRGGEVPVSDVAFKDDTVSFHFSKSGNVPNRRTYSGKLSGDTITGYLEIVLNDQTERRDWVATRAKAQ